MYDGEDVDGSPFTVRVYDPGQLKISGLNNGVVGTAVHFASNYQSNITYSRPRVSNFLNSGKSALCFTNRLPGNNLN